MIAKRSLALLVASVIVASGCADENPVSPGTMDRLASLSVLKGAEGVRQVEGEIGPGATYALFVPEVWNGRLVLYAHGFRDAETPVDLRDQDNLASITGRLTAQGYAVGYSSYSENGYAVKDGMQRTQQLRGIFASRFGQPDKTLLMGHSLGGLIALGLAERFPEHYAGALVICGITGGSQAEVDYVANIRVLFDYFHPGVVPGELLDVPAGTRPKEDVEVPAMRAMTASLAHGSPESLRGAYAIAALMEGLGTPIPFIRNAGQAAEIQTLVGSIVYALSFHARGFEDLVSRTHGHSPFDNMGTVYTGALPQPVLDAVNSGVDRFNATPDARNYLQKYYTPSGSLQIPLVTLSNRFDPIAPSFHSELFRAAVSASGRSGLLVERSSANPFAYGHCNLTVDETMNAFAELSTRVGG